MTEIDISNFENEIVIRKIQEEDIDEIVQIAQLGFENADIAFERKHYESHINIFPEGQVCVLYNGKIIGSSSSLIVNYDEYGDEHSIDDISGNGYITNHNPNGKNLYGIDVVVHPDFRHLKIGRRLYEERRKLCKKYNLESIIFGGRIPNYHKYADKLTAEEYVEQVKSQNIYDPVLIFQLMNGFEIRGVKANYLLEDEASLKYATLLEWKNVDYIPEDRENIQPSRPIRVSMVQYGLKNINNFESFASRCEYFINLASKRRSNFAVFPEALTLQLLSFIDERVPSRQIRSLMDYTDEYLKLFSNLAVRYSINIIAGSHFVKENGFMYNVSFLFHRNGKIDRQYKLHITPDERKWWGIKPGSKLEVFETDCGKIAILLGYDILFPELARKAIDNGADILMTPYTVEDQQGYTRIRNCAQARAIENQVYTVITGMTGHLPQVHRMNAQYSCSAIFSPSDINFANNGVSVEADSNVEMTVHGDMNLELIRRNREVGTVTPVKDRRLNVY
ncbi:bifunctional GNAT family N-acetyltransferase/carbon-nitrogen hydrolase family protein [Lentibacillus cibarius]|uniref:GNAT family N-acetyltransferase n=1 Tax=Lentibacillus cibarius TaxID=2583219 RepID=A0A5S3QNB0_9BACI|nr:bifunctional GNAT family N-acetyltransferase/carbon-nitrogen hydrolase family protein [Lentibacillus cibarius]TMN23269.1 GNAT family N-acetyltransferase [Lentibacillus cibarius]